jgi:hypothetical protein
MILIVHKVNDFMFCISLGGYYMFIEATSRSRGAEARLISPEVPKGSKCLQFHYHMRGKDIGSLKVYTQKMGSGMPKAIVWSRTGNLGSGWRSASRSLNVTSPLKVNIKLILYRVRDRDWHRRERIYTGDPADH